MTKIILNFQLSQTWPDFQSKKWSYRCIKNKIIINKKMNQLIIHHNQSHQTYKVSNKKWIKWTKYSLKIWSRSFQVSKLKLMINLLQL